MILRTPHIKKQFVYFLMSLKSELCSGDTESGEENKNWVLFRFVQALMLGLIWIIIMLLIVQFLTRRQAPLRY